MLYVTNGTTEESYIGWGARAGGRSDLCIYLKLCDRLGGSLDLFVTRTGERSSCVAGYILQCSTISLARCAETEGRVCLVEPKL